MAESFQHKLDRVRSPRVQITYDVETNGAMQQRELAFVVGVLADLSGHRPEAELDQLKDRKFVEIHRDNINDVMDKAAPTLTLTVANRLVEGDQLTDNNKNIKVSDLKFHSLDDFAPAKVAENVPALRALLEMRKRLDEVLARVSTNTQLESVLQDVLANTDKVQALAKEMGINTGEGK